MRLWASFHPRDEPKGKQAQDNGGASGGRRTDACGGPRLRGSAWLTSIALQESSP